MTSDDELLFGVEEEFFLFQTSSQVPSHENINRLLEMLVVSGCKPIGQSAFNSPVAVVMYQGNHSVTIKNDHCTHILELAFSPLYSLADFRLLWDTAFKMLEPIFISLGLKIVSGAVLPTIPEFLTRSNETDPDGKRFGKLLNRSPTGRPLFEKKMVSCICSTQVSLGIEWNRISPHLENLYAYEFLFPLYFSNGNRFLDHHAPAIRPLIIQDNFGPEFGIVGFPVKSDDFSTIGDQFSRSYAYIADRGNRIEFRSADCQGNCERILQIVELRKAILHTAMNTVSKIPLQTSRSRFYQACRGLLSPSEAIDFLSNCNTSTQIYDLIQKIKCE